jgi:LacI family transcriptional regulator, xylobiose transport system transcriptional regulator
MTAVGADAKLPGRRRGEITVADIARLAGVSAPTVSRVINGQSGVALGTRQRVEAVIREHGYRRAAGGNRAAILELVFHALESLWALEIIRGVEEIARQHQLAVVLTEMEGRLTPGSAWTEEVLSRRPVGVIAVFSELTVQQQSQLATRSIPLVALDPTGEPLHQTPSVGATNWSGGLARGAERGRVRRSGVHPVGRPADDHGPPAAHPDGPDGRGAGHRHRQWPAAGEQPRRAGDEPGRAAEHGAPAAPLNH